MRQPYEKTIETVLGTLETALVAVNTEIAHYPSPISGCDAQFNRLLGDRMRISQALRALADEPFHSDVQTCFDTAGDAIQRTTG